MKHRVGVYGKIRQEEGMTGTRKKENRTSINQYFRNITFKTYIEISMEWCSEGKDGRHLNQPAGAIDQSKHTIEMSVVCNKSMRINGITANTQTANSKQPANTKGQISRPDM